MKIPRQLREIAEKTLSTRDKQNNINVSEVFHLWNHLIQRYNIIDLTNSLEPFTKDEDLIIVLKIGKKTLSDEINLLEQEMMVYGIPLPIRPPKQAQTISNYEFFSDRYIFRRILRGIQSFIPTHTMAFIHSTSPKIREMFMSFVIEEMKLYDKFLEYGKIKGYEVLPPSYRQ